MTESPSSVADAVLLALAHVEANDLCAARTALTELSAAHPGHPDVVDGWVSIGDAAATAGAAGVEVLKALIPIARSWPDAMGQSTLMMALAELELTLREPTWSAHWLKAAMTAAPADPRPWELLEVMLDDHPGLPVGRSTLKMLEHLRKARGELPVNEEDFSGITFDEWTADNG
jgi:predicted Zn-dependent protease